MADSSNTNSNETQASPGTGLNAVIRHMTTKRIETVLLTIRLATLIFTLLYLVPFSPFATSNLYQKALLANAAVSALRLHQRLPPFRFTREYFAMLLLEDSAHYLFFSLIFITNLPITLVLLPITLFSLLHACSAILSILNSAGMTGSFRNAVQNVLSKYQREIMYTIALTEIALMPTIIFAIMAGLASIFTPLMYYQFLTLRYTSRRNPYNRQAFHWLRVSIQNHVIQNQRCPGFLRNILYKGIDLVCNLAPVHET